INPSPTDTKNYNRAFNWADFANTYAAPPRVLAALYGEFPGIPDGRGHLYAGLLAQFDLSNAQERFNTQYLLLRHSLSYKSLDLNLAGAIELENTKAKGIAGAYAVSLEGGLLLPAALRSRLSLTLNWASGEGPDAAAYFPIVREAQGMVFQPQFSGMMTIRAQYEARFFQSLSGNLGARYFIRTDTSSYVDPDLTDSSYFIGAELYAGLLWIPFSDLSFFLNGGAFLPKTGSAMTSDAPVRWLVNLGTTFSF
ncbi:MAG: hypothetical protein FWF29_12665, partial [Treponema sp.]|nr:hypothetical protein [Treponema sp.]